MLKRLTKYCILGMAIITAINLGSCGNHTAPQSPTHRSNSQGRIDSTQLQAMEYNTQLAKQANQAVLRYTQQDSTHQYEALDGTSWICRLKAHPNEPSPQEDERWRISLHVFDLNGNALMEIADSYTIGKSELPVAVDLAIRQMHDQEEAIVVAPWYLAFGGSGTKAVEAYTNVVIYINISL